MAITNKEEGVWILDEVYNKQNEGGIWATPGSVADPGKLFAWGYNSYGTLGQNDRTTRSSPTQIPGTTWTQISPSGYGSGFNASSVKSDGTLWTWGNNYYGELGLNGPSNAQRSSPVQIGTGTDWKGIAGSSGGYATKTDGTMWVWGHNEYGKLGLNKGEAGLPAAPDTSSPTQLPGTTWQVSNNKASSSSWGFLTIKTDGTLWSWGANWSGCLGLNQGPNSVHSKSSPCQVGTDTNWSNIAGNGISAWGVKTDGTAWAWGRNEYGELAQNNTSPSPTGLSSPTQIGTGTNWGFITRTSSGGAVATKTDGTLWSWGYNRNRQLGQNNYTKYSSPTQIGTDTNWSTMLGTVASMEYSISAIKTDGTLWSWGYNHQGQLGHNSRTDVGSPVQVPGTGWKKLQGIGSGVMALQEL